MKLSTRLTRTLAIAALAVSGSIAVAPAVSASVQGPDDITNPAPCPTHGSCGGDHDGPGDFKNPEANPNPDPQPDPDPKPDEPTADHPVVVSQPTFTG
jgi:hypothetical protein